MSTGWQLYVFIIVLGSFIAHFVFLRWSSSYKTDEKPDANHTTGHRWDGDLEELNNPLPRWWLNLFQLTVVFGIAYLVFYPGSGIYDGALNWSQEQQYAEQVASAEARYSEIFASYAAQDFATLQQNSDAMTAGLNLFGNNCAQCHGSDARGAFGFPNLTDSDWLWDNSNEQIATTIRNGRNGVMPAWGAALGGDTGVTNMAHYVLSLSGLEHDADSATAGQAQYSLFCVACHGATGEGNTLLGAPNLKDDIWLYSASLDSIKQTIDQGRNNQMPAFGDALNEDKVKVLTAYIKQLGH